MKKIAILASGGGTNAQAITSYLNAGNTGRVALLVTNRSRAGVIDRLEPLGVPARFFGKSEWLPAAMGGNDGREVTRLLREEGVDLVVLAGFLAIIPPAMIEAFEGRIVNIHPSLLPKYGGVGMYGEHVHKAVLEAAETRSGITIHLVTDCVDGGDILLQATCEVKPDDTPDTLAARIHPLEHRYYPQVVEQLLLSM